jgi:hypothetical protein
MLGKHRNGARLGLAIASALALGLGVSALRPAGAAPVARAPLRSEPDVAPSPPSPPPRAPAFDVAVISDLNSSYGSTHYGPAVHEAVAALTGRFRPKLVLITGDMVAGQKASVNAPAMWRAFHGAVTDRLEGAGISIAPTPGNHDASPSFASERAEYVRQWAARPTRLSFVDGSKYPLRYSFTFEGAFFLSLDAASVGPLSEEQRGWVETQLERARSFPVKVVFGHLPLYPVARAREREILYDAKLESLLVRHGVSAYVSGHHHAYYPGRASSVRHVAMPCLGAGARPLIGQQGASAQALVLLKVDGDRLSSVEAYSAPSFSGTIARTRLPPKIALGQYVLTRDDLADASASVARAQ